MGYTLIKCKDTKEYHLFKGKSSKSICKKMSQPCENIEHKFSYKDEDEARLKCAEVGRKVCGICISHLYKTEK